MREGIHPEYKQVKVRCNCGNEFVTGSTKDEIRVESLLQNAIPSTQAARNCFWKAGGRVEKFKQEIRTEK